MLGGCSVAESTVAASLIEPSTMRSLLCLLAVALFSIPALADGPKDNVADNVRQIPPPGIEVPADVRKSLTDGAAARKTTRQRS